MAENNPLDAIPEKTEQRIFVYSGQNGQLQIEFAEGLRDIPDYVIQAVGGIEKLKEMAPDLHNVNFADFITEFEQEMQKQALNTFQANFVNTHFNKLF
jgi:hypothetical protein